MTEVIRFTQETCGACTTQREKNEGIEGAYPGVEFREVDVRTDLETAEEYGVRKTPTTLVSANGEPTSSSGSSTGTNWRRLSNAQTGDRRDSCDDSPASYADEGNRILRR